MCRSGDGGMEEGWKRVGGAWDGRTERWLAFPGRENDKDPWLDRLFVRTQLLYTARLSPIFTDIYLFVRRHVNPICALHVKYASRGWYVECACLDDGSISTKEVIDMFYVSMR